MIMIELTEKAAKYAAEKANEVIANALAKAYEDGYRDGYKDREEEIPVDLRDNKTEYVDLGLPSGTLWAKEYEKENGNTLYLPYEKAARLHLPTIEQWEELLTTCQWRPNYYNNSFCFSAINCIGPNGTIITFDTTGLIEVYKIDPYHCCFWINSGEEDTKMIDIFNSKKYQTWEGGIKPIFSGFKLPIRQVR